MITRITDGSGTRWVEIPPRKRRASPRALRFAGLQVGDQLMQTHTLRAWRGGKDDFSKPAPELSQTKWYYLVTDLWIDPVSGQDDPVAGQMAAIVRIDEDGYPHGRKWPHTLRGLASQGFHYADRDYIAFCRQREAATEAGSVVGIGLGQVIRRRPKTPGGRL